MRKKVYFSMEEQYTNEEFESYMGAMKHLSDFLRSQNSNFIFAPIVGSVPLIDVLSVIDRHFPLETVEYPPNSSRFLSREQMMQDWFTNFLKTNYHGDPLSITCIDEVISGSSAVKGHREFQKALHGFERGLDSRLGKEVKYNICAIGESPKKGKRNHGFNRLVHQGVAKVFEAGKIITSDNRDLNPVRLKQGEMNRQHRQTYLPEIESLNYGEKYLGFLHNVATYCGVDPDQVSTAHLLKIQTSLEKYLTSH
jgi:hypothetical protein